MHVVLLILQIINRLILVGADVRAKDNDERIPLHLAAEFVTIQFFNKLLLLKNEVTLYTCNFFFYQERSRLCGESSRQRMPRIC